MKTQFLSTLKTSILVAILIWLVRGNAMAQTAADYRFNAYNTSDLLTDLNGNVINISAAVEVIGSKKSNMNSGSSVLPIGFTFRYFGRNYTRLSFNTNGLIKLDSSTSAVPVAGTEGVSEFINSTSTPFIAALAVPMKTGSGVYLTSSGTAPFRCLQVSWYEMGLGVSNNKEDVTYQVRIYETSNIIEFAYWKMSTSGISSSTFVAGIHGSSSQRIGVTNTTNNTVTSTNYTGINLNNTNIVALSNKTYRFTPPAGNVNITSIATNSSTVLSIPANVEVVVNQSTTVGGIRMNEGSDLTLATGITLTVNGDINTTAATPLTGNPNASLVINGTGASSSVAFNQGFPGKSNSLKKLQINRTGGSVTLANSLVIAPGGIVTLTAGQLILPDTLWLNSDATGTAMVDVIPSANLGSNFGGTNNNVTYSPVILSANGKVVASRYIPSVARRWRFLGTCIKNAKFDDLKKEIFITGAGTGTTPGTNNSNGFDATQTNAPSVFSYNEAATGVSSNGWVALTNNTTSLASQMLVAGKGYRVFVRGDRSDISRLNATNGGQNAVTVNFIGDFNKGNISMPVTYTNSNLPSEDGWNLLTNPYPAGFNWDAFHDAGRRTGNTGGTNYTNIDATVYIYNAQKNGYVSYNAVSNVSSDTSFTNGVIPSGASFYVKATSSNPVLLFKEIFKFTTTSTTTLFKTANNLDELHIKATADSITWDMAVLKYDRHATNGSDEMDIKKMGGDVNLNLYDIADSTLLTASLRNGQFAKMEIIPMTFTSNRNGNHSFTFTGTLFNNHTIVLHDAYVNKTVAVKDGSAYAFSINNSIAASKGSARFTLIVTKGGSLPVELIAYNAAAVKTDVLVTWSTGSELNNDHFEIEFSKDAVNFEKAGEVTGNGTTNEINSYSFIHSGAFNASTVCYRIRQVDLDGTFSYSPIMVIKGTELTETKEINVFPMPAADIINLNYNGKTVSTISISNMQGGVVATAIGAPETMNLESLATGAYIISFTDNTGNIVQTQKLIISK